MNKLAPIVLFVYNRPQHTRRTIESLVNVKGAAQSNLYIFSDGAKNGEDSIKVNEVRNYLKSVKGFKNIEIVEKEKNIGLADSVIGGVSDVFQDNENAVVLEDDLMFSENFLSFINSALDFYKDSEEVYSISGYNFPINISSNYKYDIYFSPRASSWGWATWKNRWEKVDWNINDFDEFVSNKTLVNEFNRGGNDLTRMLRNQVNGKIDSWAIRWSYAHFKNNAYCVYPVKSKVQNIGTDSSGFHSITTDRFRVELDDTADSFNFPADIKIDERILKNFSRFFKLPLWERIYWRLKRNFKIINQ